MAEIRVRDVSAATASEVAWFCVPPERRADPTFRIGAGAKEVWIREKLARGEPGAKIAYLGTEPVGIIQYEPIPEESAIHILCVFVPDNQHGRQGVGTTLLTSVIDDARQAQPWNGGQPAAVLTTQAFPGHGPDQLPAREFFQHRGFHPVSDDPNFLVLPLQAGVRYQRRRTLLTYLPQAEDAGQALILHGPSFCPWIYPFHVQAMQVLHEIAPRLHIRWVDRAQEPDAARKRGGYEGIVVNRRPIRSFVLDREEFTREVREALAG